MYISTLTIEHFRGFEQPTTFKFNKGLNVLIGENDCGKTSILDAIRYVLGTTDQGWIKIEESDFFNEDTSKEISIKLKFEDLTNDEQACFLECLSYDDDKKPVLFINYSGKRNQFSKKTRLISSISCGRNSDIPQPSAEAKERLEVTYLRALRDAYTQMKSGRNSRLSQILNSIESVNEGNDFDSQNIEQKITELSLSGIVDLSNYLVENKQSITSVNNEIGSLLKEKLLLNQENLTTHITVSDNSLNPSLKVKRLLEKLDLKANMQASLFDVSVGLGTSNLMYMACEMLLNKADDGFSSFLLIEEPEAHLHAQRQLKLIQSIQNMTPNQQIFITTHSPLLTSVVDLKNLILIQDKKAYPMGKGYTNLDDCDYEYLQRYLDATKANLFFAKGVIIVEGPGEEFLLPSIAKIIGKNLTDYGISVVDVRSIGLRRYAKIFQRKENDVIHIPVACITDRDVMPDCALGVCTDSKYTLANKASWPSRRKWKVESEISNKAVFLEKIKERADGQNVRTFIAPQWTLEYELAIAGLSQLMLLVIAKLMYRDRKKCAEKLMGFRKEYQSYGTKEEKASFIYSFFYNKDVSKAEFAQHFALELEKVAKRSNILSKLPQYLKDAIEYAASNI